MKRMKTESRQLSPLLKNNRHLIILTLIGILSFCLNFYAISKYGYGNEYYAAAIKSMTMNFKNFFFLAFDPSGMVSVDKPPLGLWIQAIFVLIFGYHGWAMLLPQALAGTASCIMLYILTAKYFGRPAGLLSSLIFAVTPAVVVASRNNTIDMQLILVLLIATWFLFKSIDTKKWRWLFIAAGFIGLGFNIKMLQAYMVVPAFAIIYLIFAKEKFAKRLLAGIISVAIIIAVSFAWVLAVDLYPSDKRPYVDSSTNNTVMELVFGHNGTERLFGQGAGGGSKTGFGKSGSKDGTPPSMQNQNSNSNNSNTSGSSANNTSSSSTSGNSTGSTSNSNTGNNSAAAQESSGNPAQGSSGGSQPTPPNGGSPNGGSQNGGPQGGNSQNGGTPPAMPNQNNSSSNNTSSNSGSSNTQNSSSNQSSGNSQQAPPSGGNNSFKNKNGGNGGGVGGDEIGSASITRLWTSNMYGQASWLLIFVLFGILAYIRKINIRKLTLKQGVFAFWGLWLATMFAFFSFAGFYHRYYLCMMAPAIAVLSAVGLVKMAKDFKEKNKWRQFLLPISLIATLSIELVYVWSYSSLRAWLIPIMAVSGIAALVLMAIHYIRPKRLLLLIGTVCMMISILAAPFYWALTPVMYVTNTTMPYADPNLASQSGGIGGGMQRNSDGKSDSSNTENTKKSDKTDSRTSGLEKYLVAHYKKGSFLVVTQRASDVAQYIIDTGLPAYGYGGFLGSDNSLTLAKLKKLVAQGKITYFLLSSEGGGSSNSEIINYVKQHATLIDSSEYGESSSQTGNSSQSSNQTNTASQQKTNVPSSQSTSSKQASSADQPSAGSSSQSSGNSTQTQTQSGMGSQQGNSDGQMQNGGGFQMGGGNSGSSLYLFK